MVNKIHQDIRAGDSYKAQRKTDFWDDKSSQRASFLAEKQKKKSQKEQYVKKTTIKQDLQFQIQETTNQLGEEFAPLKPYLQKAYNLIETNWLVITAPFKEEISNVLQNIIAIRRGEKPLAQRIISSTKLAIYLTMLVVSSCGKPEQKKVENDIQFFPQGIVLPADFGEEQLEELQDQHLQLTVDSLKKLPMQPDSSKVYFFDHADSLFVKENMPLSMQAKNEYDEGDRHYTQKERVEALEHYETAEDMYEEADDKVGVIQSKLAQGFVNYQLGEDFAGFTLVDNAVKEAALMQEKLGTYSENYTSLRISMQESAEETAILMQKKGIITNIIAGKKANYEAAAALWQKSLQMYMGAGRIDSDCIDELGRISKNEPQKNDIWGANVIGDLGSIYLRLSKVDKEHTQDYLKRAEDYLKYALKMKENALDQGEYLVKNIDAQGAIDRFHTVRDQDAESVKEGIVGRINSEAVDGIILDYINGTKTHQLIDHELATYIDAQVEMGKSEELLQNLQSDKSEISIRIHGAIERYLNEPANLVKEVLNHLQQKMSYLKVSIMASHEELAKVQIIKGEYDEAQASLDLIREYIDDMFPGVASDAIENTGRNYITALLHLEKNPSNPNIDIHLKNALTGVIQADNLELEEHIRYILVKRGNNQEAKELVRLQERKDSLQNAVSNEDQATIMNEKAEKERALKEKKNGKKIQGILALMGLIILGRGLSSRKREKKLRKAHKDLKKAHSDLGIEQQKTKEQALQIALKSQKLEENAKEINLKNEELQSTNEELQSTLEKLSIAHDEIKSSIAYAARLQRGLIKSHLYLDKVSMENVWYFRPRDGVGGDFGIADKIGKYRVLCAADCTGHGVPGGFLTVLGIKSFAEWLSKGIAKDMKPSEVMDGVRLSIKDAFKGEEVVNQDAAIQDGMDAALCFIDEQNMLHFSGANATVRVIREGGLIEIKGDKQPIGPHLGEKPFVTHSVQLNKGDIVYLKSDGYQDQFGGQKGRKFMTKRLKDLILALQNVPLEKHHEILDAVLDAWRGRHQIDPEKAVELYLKDEFLATLQTTGKTNIEQVDDILLMAIKI